MILKASGAQDKVAKKNERKWPNLVFFLQFASLELQPVTLKASERLFGRQVVGMPS